MLPLTKRDWIYAFNLKQKIKIGSKSLSEEEVIAKNVEWLIERIYSPDEAGAVIKKEFLTTLGLEDLAAEAINWGSLGVTGIEKYRDIYEVIIEEADPNAQNLQKYIKGWMEKWGWKIIAKTEW